jgi:3-dehydroquinate synthase
MAGSSMSDSLIVRSSKGEYSVTFTSASERVATLVAAGAQVVCDANVARIHANIVAGVPQDQLVVLDAIEPNKTMDKSQWLMQMVSQRQLRRNQQLVAIGGGIVQDITAFSASILYRGIDWTFIPTTLLAQADSCIGGKTSINLGDRKNLVGSFHPPSDVIVDLAFLESLSNDDIRSGIGEMLHYYLYADSPQTQALVDDQVALLKDRARFLPHIWESLTIKRDVIEEDEFDRGERNKFNYGHTFGHALEAVTRFAINHGQAVTVGMDLANRLSTERGMLDAAESERLHGLLVGNLPNYDWATLDLNEYLSALSSDKKNVSADLTCILSRGPGKLFKHALPIDDSLRTSISEYFGSLT